MRKENPLFVDSTKTRGDNIKATFELSNVLLHDSERIVIKVVEEPQGRQHELPMRKERDFDIYTARIFLQHKNKIRFQFVVLKENEVLLTSPILSDEVNYIIEQSWEPVTDQELLFEKKKVEEAEPSSETPAMIEENRNILGSIVKQWGF